MTVDSSNSLAPKVSRNDFGKPIIPGLEHNLKYLDIDQLIILLVAKNSIYYKHTSALNKEILNHAAN